MNETIFRPFFQNDKFRWKRILIEFFCCPEYRNLWSPLPETLLNNLDPAVALADLANIVLHPDIKLPVQVYHEKKTTTDVTINCLESDDLQGFKPLSKSSIGDVSDHFFRNWRLKRIFWPNHPGVWTLIQWRMWRRPFHVFDTIIGTRVEQSSFRIHIQHVTKGYKNERF